MKGKQDVESKLSTFNLIGLLILFICYAGAIYNVFKIKGAAIATNKKVIRIAHWQLELGIRDAIAELAKNFQALYPDVEIVQIPITERAYAQWVTTQLIGRTAPDLIELGMFNVPDYCSRYFLPLGEELKKPNPYNENDPALKNLPWIETFHDGLASTYISSLLDYYGVGFSRFTIRIFYNKRIFRKVLGHDTPPKNLTELFEICDKIRIYAENRNNEINKYNQEVAQQQTLLQQVFPLLRPKQKSKFILDPIASSRYQVNLFRPRYTSMLTAKRLLELDINLDGHTSFEELILALLKKEITYEDEHNIASLNLMKDFAKYFNPGFMSIDRMDAGFAFVQGKAAMITSGSWDASSFIKKIQDQPAGDAILEINQTKVSSAEEAEKILLDLASKNHSVELLIERDGIQRKISVTPKVKGKSLWDYYGIEIENIVFPDNHQKVFITDIDELSPAHKAGLKKRMTFDVGIFDFPLPKNHPVYGKYFAGNVKEVSGTGFAFGVVKFSPHVDLAIKFLQFATTPQNNQRLNERAQWIPAVKGAKPIEMLEPFEPNEEGLWGWLNFGLDGGRSSMIEGQLYWPFISGETTTEQYLKKMNELMPSACAIDYVNTISNYNEKSPDKNYLRSVWLAKFAFHKSESEYKESLKKLPAAWENYIGFKNGYPRHLIYFTPINKNRPDHQFSREFFKTYDTLSIKK